MDEKCLYQLFSAIVIQAVKDYKSAVRKRNFYTINECEEFFLSDYGQALSYNNGEKIIEHFKSQAHTRRIQNGR